MPDEPNDQTPPANSDPIQPEPVSTPPDTPTDPFKFGDSSPEFLRGKTEAEAVDLVNNLVSVAQQLAAQQQQPQQQAPVVSQTQAPDADLALTDPKAYQDQLAAHIRQQTQSDLANAAGPVFTQLATIGKEMSKNDPGNKDVWSKWGHEVEQMVANVPAHQRSKELYDQAVTLVKGRHVDEIAAERAQRLAAANPTLARSTDGSAPVGVDDNSDVWETVRSSALGATAFNELGKSGILRNIGPGKAYNTLEDFAEAMSKSQAHVGKGGSEIVNRTVGVAHNVR